MTVNRSSSVLLTHGALLISEREVCKKLRISASMLQKMRRTGTGPAFVRIGKAVRYPAAALADWLSALTPNA